MFNTHPNNRDQDQNQDIRQKTNTCASPDGGARVGGSFPSIDSPPFDTLGAEQPYLLEQNGHAKAQALSNGRLAAQQEAWFTAWWVEYWLHKAKKPALQAFRKAVKTAAQFEQVMAATRAQSAEMLAREPSKRPHASSWLSQERWNDEQEPPKAQPQHGADDYPEIRQ